MARKYFTLACREADGKFHPQFGDYDRECVVQEREDTYERDYKKSDMKIIVSGDRQVDVTAALAKLNGGNNV